MSLILIVVLVLLAAVAGFLAGVSYTVRTWKRKQGPPPGARSIPFPDTSCDRCRENFPDWVCWVGGCP